jgi:hypothetical protein
LTFSLSPNPPIFSVELVPAERLFSGPVLQALFRNLSDVTDAGRHGDPVALWLRHVEGGNSWVSSTSELKSVLCHHRKSIEEVQFHHLGEQCQAAVRDILGAYFMEEGNLCENIYAGLDLDLCTPAETAHFRTFSVFWQSGTFEEFESEWENLDEVEPEFEETRVLKACASAPRSCEDAIAQRMEIRRGLRLIQGYGVIGNGEFAFDETDWHWRRRDPQG